MKKAAFGLGLVIGKFYPPHRGHQYLIETALRECERLEIIVCGQEHETIPGEHRGAWLAELYPQANVRVIDDRYGADDSVLWARLTRQWLGRFPDAVFTSEDYGEHYCREMQCTHRMVDRARQAVQCSATMIRADPFLHWDFLAPPVRGWFAKRVCVVGAESTGTTTLAAALAEALGTSWVAEYGREYSEVKLRAGESAWESAEFVLIAAEQNRREELAARAADRVMFGDTDAWATGLWHRRYLGSENPAVAALAAQRRCDLYLLTGDEIPFVQDGLRDGEHIRHEMHGWFRAALERQPVPWKLLTGSHAGRLEAALAAVDALFADSQWKPQRR